MFVMGNSLGLIIFFVMDLDGLVQMIKRMMLLFEHEIDRNVLQYGFLWNMGLGSLAVIVMSKSCALGIIIVDFMVFSVINGYDHVFELIV